MYALINQSRLHLAHIFHGFKFKIYESVKTLNTTMNCQSIAVCIWEQVAKVTCF